MCSHYVCSLATHTQWIYALFILFQFTLLSVVAFCFCFCFCFFTDMILASLIQICAVNPKVVVVLCQTLSAAVSKLQKHMNLLSPLFVHICTRVCFFGIFLHSPHKSQIFRQQQRGCLQRHLKPLTCQQTGQLDQPAEGAHCVRDLHIIAACDFKKSQI